MSGGLDVWPEQLNKYNRIILRCEKEMTYSHKMEKPRKGQVWGWEGEESGIVVWKCPSGY